MYGEKRVETAKFKQIRRKPEREREREEEHENQYNKRSVFKVEVIVCLHK